MNDLISATSAFSASALSSVLGGHGRADLLGGGVAARLRFLELGDMGARRISSSSIRAGAFRSSAPRLLQRFVELVGIVADPTDIEHGSGPVR
jgi:hypothetical protein